MSLHCSLFGIEGEAKPDVTTRVPVQEKTLHPPPPVRGGTGRGGGTLVPKFFSILPCPERGGGIVAGLNPLD